MEPPSTGGSWARTVRAVTCRRTHVLLRRESFEFSVKPSLLGVARTFSSEVQPIVGLHLKPWDFIFNPIVDTDYTGGVRNLQFKPATRVA